MPAYRFPILVCEDHAGRFTALLVEDAGGTAAVGTTYADAVRRLKDYLEWLHRQEPWRAEPDFLEASLVWLKVEVRPEYVTDERKFPVHEPVGVRVPCVRGRDEGGLLLCAMPTLGTRFDFYEEKAFRGLATHYAQGVLEGKTPRELHRFLPPRDATTDDLIVHVPKKLRERVEAPTYKTLDAVAEPIGSRALRGRLARPWERDAEVNALVATLARERVNVLLVGEGGVGKSAILAEAVRKVERGLGGDSGKSAADLDAWLALMTEGIVQRSAASDGGSETPEPGEPGTAPGEAARGRPPGGRYRFWLTSAARVIAGMQYLGQWEQRVEALIGELSNFAGVLCFDSALDLVRVGGQGPGDSVAAFLMPYMQRGELRVVAEATPAELDALRRLLPGFADLFHVRVVPPFARQQATAALTQVADSLRQNLRVDFEPGVPDLTYRLFARFLPYQGFPGPASAFLSATFDRARRDKLTSASRARMIDAFVKQTGLPEHLLRDEVRLDANEVLAHFRSRVIGQDAACRAATDLVMTFKAGLNDPGRPLGVMLFAGPTGVGKTELARALARYLFGHGGDAAGAGGASGGGDTDRRLLRLDMSEYAGPDAAERLLGDARRNQPSDLVKRIRQQPFTVVLLDEIEKAAPEVFDVLLNVFDEGRLTDAFGRLSTFRSAVIIMTSNLGSATAGGPFGLSRSSPASAYESEVMSFFRPEFFNRIDAVVTFNPLAESTIHAITEKELTDLGQREGLTRANLKLSWTPDVVRVLSSAGFDPRYGARPLQRTIETMVVTPLSRLLVERPYLRDTTIKLSVAEGRIVFS
jgi:ATP-dependent Clp protease ATP-binding subunit ClpC